MASWRLCGGVLISLEAQGLQTMENGSMAAPFQRKHIVLAIAAAAAFVASFVIAASFRWGCAATATRFIGLLIVPFMGDVLLVGVALYVALKIPARSTDLGFVRVAHLSGIFLTLSFVVPTSIVHSLSRFTFGLSALPTPPIPGTELALGVDLFWALVVGSLLFWVLTKTMFGISLRRAALVSLIPIAGNVCAAWIFLFSFFAPLQYKIAEAVAVAKEGRPIVCAIYEYEDEHNAWPTDLSSIKTREADRALLQSWRYWRDGERWVLSKTYGAYMLSPGCPPSFGDGPFYIAWGPCVFFSHRVRHLSRDKRWIMTGRVRTLDNWGRECSLEMNIDQPMPE